MKKGYVISLVVIGLLIVLSVGLLMKDLTSRNLSDNLKPNEKTSEKTTKKEEPKPEENPQVEVTQLDAQAPTTNITITNKQDSNDMANYSYQIKITNVSGAMLTVKNNEREYLVFDARGNASFNLLSNESITIVDVPVNATYTITQDKKDGFKTLVNGSETATTSGTINNENTIVFTNNVVAKTTTPAPQVPSEPEGDVKNPVTSDKGMLAVTISLVALFTLILLKALKLDRYEEL